MTREEAIEVLENGEWWEELAEWYMIVHPEHDKLHDAVDMAISALREQEHFRDLTKKVEPLTLNELRQLPIRDWVWIEILNPDAFRSKETVSAYYRKYDGYKKDEIFWCGHPGLGVGFDYADYGKTWMAYRQKPEEGTD